MEGILMAGIEPVSGTGAANALAFATEYQARVVSLQKDAVEMQGKMSLQLIQAAVSNTQVGQQLNVLA
jgi:hypothetical protein